ncbi:HRDC domain-containing protein [Pelagibacteraceae bacterium]|nr:HRDC domain-containing protein [Pelagibacteraceae bacterium]
MELVQDNKSLKKITKSLKKNDVLYIDTEFLRNNTYWPKLCLIQIKAKKKIYLIDALAKINIIELKEILTDSRILKVFHSARQDIEVLMYTYQIIPWPIYDTQIAANFIYEDNDIGYGNLVEKICSKKLNKKYQVSDWSRRPLKNKQIEYAALDVEYLPALYKELEKKIRAKRKVRQFKVEIEKLKDIAEIYNPKKSYNKINVRKKNLIKSRLKLLSEWRELSAQKLNVPRNWIISDKTILSASKKNFKIEKLSKNLKNKNFDQKIESFKKFLVKKVLP